MKNLISLLSILSILYSANAQQIQYASKVIKFSSDLGGKQNSIKKILGKPDCFPQGGASPNAWMPKNALDGRQVIEVGFDNPQTVKQVAIFENINAGNVYKIAVDNGSGKYETVWTRKFDYKTPFYRTTLTTDRSYYFKKKRRKIEQAPDVEVNAGIENAILDQAVSNVVAVKIFFTFATIAGSKQVDAIAISDSDAPINVKINTRPFFENLPNATLIDLPDLDYSNPMLSADNSKLYFSTDVDNQSIIGFATKNAAGIWANPATAGEVFNTNQNFNFIEYFDTNFILKGGAVPSANSTETGFEILENQSGKYVSTGQIKIPAYNNFDQTGDATITADKKTLVLAIESDQTQGGSDLYFSMLKPDGSYGLLQNFGKSINTAAEEANPFLLSDQKTLLFASNGYSSFGSFDIYITQRLDDTWKKWSEPINLGSKINSAGFDGSHFYDEKNEMLYYTQTTNERSQIYAIKIQKSILMTNQ